MKKNLVWLLVMMMTVGLMTGCGSSSSSTADTTAAVTEAASVEETVSQEAMETAGEETPAAEAGENVEILVAAAASLKNAYEDKLIPMFQEENPGVTVVGTYGSSGDLQTQIEEGLEADVFMSAATKQMTALDEGGYIASESIVNLLENKIVLIVPTGEEEGFAAFEDITKADAIALGDPASVPAGQYAGEALTALGIWDEIQDRVSLGKDVTEVLNQVAAGSADAGIVYATDAASMSDQVSVIAEAPEGSLAQKVIYPVAVVKATTHETQAQAFVEFLQSDEAIAVFEEYGFAKNAE